MKEQRCLNLGPKTHHLGIFGQEFQILSYLKPALSNLTKMSFQFTLNFGVGFAFFKGPGYVFSECPSPLPGPVYNECRTQAYNAKHSTPQSFVSL